MGNKLTKEIMMIKENYSSLGVIGIRKNGVGGKKGKKNLFLCIVNCVSHKKNVYPGHLDSELL